jgi:hypothetical protein
MNSSQVVRLVIDGHVAIAFHKYSIALKPPDKVI